MVSVGVDCAPEGERDQMATKRLANIVFVSEWPRGLTGLRRLSKLMYLLCWWAQPTNQREGIRKFLRYQGYSGVKRLNKLMGDSY